MTVAVKSGRTDQAPALNKGVLPVRQARLRWEQMVDRGRCSLIAKLFHRFGQLPFDDSFELSNSRGADAVDLHGLRGLCCISIHDCPSPTIFSEHPIIVYIGCFKIKTVPLRSAQTAVAESLGASFGRIDLPGSVCLSGSI